MAYSSIPWNYPLMMWAWKVGPALAAGCTILMKPSELTPITALVLCELAKEAGIPAGVINTLPGLGATTGDAISRHMGIDKIAFTGSVATGRRISIAAAESNLKKATLELGGKSPSLVFESADIEDAARWTAMGIFFNSGQDCCASSRVSEMNHSMDLGLTRRCTSRSRCTTSLSMRSSDVPRSARLGSRTTRPRRLVR